MKQTALTESVFYILLSLQQPLHGYGIIQNIKRLSHDRISMAPGTLYGAINTLLKKDWIVQVSEEGPKGKKEYMMTNTGKKVLETEINRLQELAEVGKQYMRGEYNE